MENHDDTHSITAPKPSNDDKSSLKELLEETRILLPGTEVLVAFLIGLPFTERFDRLTGIERNVFVFTFFAAVVAMICFLTPAAYHRQAQPIADKEAFKKMANRFLVIGLAPLSMALTCASYLLASMVVSTPFALAASALIGVAIIMLWWVMPYARAHRHVRTRTVTELKHQHPHVRHVS